MNVRSHNTNISNHGGSATMIFTLINVNYLIAEFFDVKFLEISIDVFRGIEQVRVFRSAGIILQLVFIV